MTLILRNTGNKMFKNSTKKMKKWRKWKRWKNQEKSMEKKRLRSRKSKGNMKCLRENSEKMRWKKVSLITKQIWKEEKKNQNLRKAKSFLPKAFQSTTNSSLK
jgi:hypothetical protein